MIISRFLSNLFFRGAWMEMSNDAGSFCRHHVWVLSPRLLRLMAKWKKKSLSPANPHYSHIAQSVLFPSRTMIRPSYMLFSLIYLCLYDHYWSLQMDFSTDQKISFQSVFHFSNTTHSHTAHTHASSVLERFNFYSFHFVLVFLRLLLFPVAAAITAAAWLCLLCLLYLDEKHLPSSVSSSFSFAYSSSLCSYAHLVLCGCVCSIETHTKAEPYVHSCNTFPAFMYTCVCVCHAYFPAVGPKHSFGWHYCDFVAFEIFEWNFLACNTFVCHSMRVQICWKTHSVFVWVTNKRKCILNKTKDPSCSQKI